MANTKEYAWSDVKINLLGRTVIGVQGVSYKTSVEKEPLFGRGNKPLRLQSGNYTFEGEIMLLQSELEALRTAVKTINPLYKITDISFDLVVSYGDGLTAVTDIVLGCEITEYEKGMEQNDKFMKITLPFMALDVQEGV